MQNISFTLANIEKQIDWRTHAKPTDEPSCIAPYHHFIFAQVFFFFSLQLLLVCSAVLHSPTENSIFAYSCRTAHFSEISYSQFLYSKNKKTKKIIVKTFIGDDN